MVTSGQTGPRCQAPWLPVTLSCVEGTEDSSYLLSLFRKYLDVLYEVSTLHPTFPGIKGPGPEGGGGDEDDDDDDNSCLLSTTVGSACQSWKETPGGGVV